MAKYGGTPPFFTQNFFFQNDSEWLEMDFKHNFLKCDILTSGPPAPQCDICHISFFLKASLILNQRWLMMMMLQMQPSFNSILFVTTNHISITFQLSKLSQKLFQNISKSFIQVVGSLFSNAMVLALESFLLKIHLL